MFTGIKLAIYAGLLFSAVGGAVGAIHVHDAKVEAAVAAKEAALNLATERTDNARKFAALELRATQAEAQAAKLATIKGAIVHAAPSSSCIRSAPVRAAVDGLRSNVGHN